MIMAFRARRRLPRGTGDDGRSGEGRNGDGRGMGPDGEPGRLAWRPSNVSGVSAVPERHNNVDVQSRSEVRLGSTQAGPIPQPPSCSSYRPARPKLYPWPVGPSRAREFMHLLTGPGVFATIPGHVICARYVAGMSAPPYVWLPAPSCPPPAAGPVLARHSSPGPLRDTLSCPPAPDLPALFRVTSCLGPPLDGPLSWKSFCCLA